MKKPTSTFWHCFTAFVCMVNICLTVLRVNRNSVVERVIVDKHNATTTGIKVR